MNTEEWQKIEKIFYLALEKDPGERPSFLEEACAGDQALRNEVESLLASDESANQFLESPASPRGEALFSDEDVSRGQIGPYKIVREIGYGGMGAVYLAARADDQYRKQVAIKLVRPGGNTVLRIHRFHTERQILANLDHPNIAKLLDGGTTEDGTPYLVMDFVEGLPIDEYCDQQKLSTIDRLQLFQTVCSAVQYAHQNLVVHRDIKPSNILVSSDGVPKLLDFGIAKLLHEAPTTKELTGSLILMTPEYASPEQVRGENITTATDIYSLGILLYGLLTGHRPYQFKNRTPAEMQRVICEQEPEKPSTVIRRVEEITDSDGERRKITPEIVSSRREGQIEKLNRRLSGDLDNIVLKALRKDPQRRYASAQQFSEDIARHLQGMPVVARKDTFGYRSGKFIRRHKMGVAATAIVILTLIAGIFFTMREAKIAAEERDKARREAAKANEIKDFMQSMLKSADPEVKGRNVTVAQILDEASQRINVELANQPEIQAAARSTIGNTYYGLGVYDAAESQLRSALATDLKLFGRKNADSGIAMNDLGLVLLTEGKLGEAEPLLRDSLAILREVLGNKHLEVARVMNNLAEVYLRKGDWAAAEKLHYEELAIRRSILGNYHRDVAQSLNDLAVVVGTKGDFAAAEKLDRESLAILRKVRGKEHPDIAAALVNIGVMLEAQNEFARAEPFFREGLQMRRKLLGHDHPLVAWTLYNYGYLLLRKGDYDAAINTCREILTFRNKTLSDKHPIVAAAVQIIGKSYVEKGDFTQGEQLLRESLGLREKALPPGNWLIACSQSLLGNCLTKLGHFKEAESLLLTSYSTLKKTVGEKHERTVEAKQWLVDLYQAWGKPDLAARYQQ
jgi:serine/threonine-protein kinase